MPGRCAGGFTILELLVVITIIALATGMTMLALRDGQQQRLEQEAVRLAALLEAARMESRASGRPVMWRPLGPSDLQRSPQGATGEPEDFRFDGLTGSRPGVGRRWLHDGTQADVLGAPGVVLGPDPILPPQRVRIRRGEQQLLVVTDGLTPFRVMAQDSP